MGALAFSFCCAFLIVFKVFKRREKRRMTMIQSHYAELEVEQRQRGGRPSVELSRLGREPTDASDASTELARGSSFEDEQASGKGVGISLSSSRIPHVSLGGYQKFIAPPNGEPPSSAPAADEGAEARRRRLEWIRYYVATNQLQEALEIGWTGKDIRKTSSRDQLVATPRSDAPSPPPPTLVGGASFADDEPIEEEEERRRLDWIRYFVEANQPQKALDLGWDGVDWRTESERLQGGMSSTSFSSLLSEPSEMTAQQLEEEETRRLSWIRHYVKMGDFDRAVELGWDGIDWRTNERVVEVPSKADEPSSSVDDVARPATLRSQQSLLRVTREAAEQAPK